MSRQPQTSLGEFLVGRATFVLALAAILYCTLHPFTLVWSRAHSLSEIVRAFDLKLISNGGLRDFFGNVLLFLPLGFGLCGVLMHLRLGRAALATVIGCGFLSALVETLQVFLPGRDPAISDIIANTLGALAGFALQRRIGNRLGCVLAWVIQTKRGIISRRALFLGLLLYALTIAGVLWHSARLLRISGWDETFWLVVGNEHTGDRPWQGKVTELSIVSRLISEESVQKLFEGATITDVMPSQLASEYNVHNWTDELGHLPALILRGSGGTTDSASSTLFSASAWRESDTPAQNLAIAANKSSAFTVVLAVATSDTRQTGLCRIVSFSKSIHDRNLMLGQDGENLFVRIRTPLTEGGSRPEFVVPRVFSDNKLHRIVLTSDGRQVRVWVDSISRQSGLYITPDMAMFWRIRPPGDREMPLEESIQHAPYLVFRACALLPAGLILALLISASRTRLQFWLTLINAVIVVPAILEVGLAILAHQPVLAQRWIGSTTIMAACAVGLFLTQTTNREQSNPSI